MASKHNNNYILSINVEGADYEIQVDDIDTANLLLNDSDAARKYIEQLNRTTGVSGPSCSTELRCDDNIIWTKKKPTQQDLEATTLLLSLRESYSEQFDDKKTNKGKLWSAIAQKLEENNFCLGQNSGERCRQKFANLTKTYVAYVRHQKKTGEERNDNIPPFFDQMHSILGSKHKVNPRHLEDTFNEAESHIQDADGEHEDTDTESGSPCTNRFKRKLKPPSRSDKIFEELRADRAERAKQFSFLQERLHKTEEQRERLLNILENALVSTSNKRKHFDVE